jgi:hypothetical protein
MNQINLRKLDAKIKFWNKIMKNRDNELLIIQTSNSSGLIITKDYFPYDDSDIEEICYSIREGDNPLYWSDCWHNDLQSILNIIEFPHKNISGKRDYISWWLNCRPTFVHESIKPLLKQKIEFYHSIGEIKNTFRNAKSGLEFNSNCLIEWHKLLQVEYGQKLIELIPKEENVWFKDVNTITLFFDSFQSLSYQSLSIKFDKSIKFQILLDYIYTYISNEVSAFSYEDKWILYNSTSGIILNKENNIDNRTMEELKIKAKDKIICYKK